MTFKESLLDLLRRSIIIRGFITAIIVITACWLWAMGHSVPSELLVLMTAVVSFYFGTLAGGTNAQQQPPDRAGDEDGIVG
jgi:hypothetical protein